LIDITDLSTTYILNGEIVSCPLNYHDRVFIIDGPFKWHSGIIKETIGCGNFLIEIPIKDKNGPPSKIIEVKCEFVIPYSESNRIALLQKKIASIKGG
jgi:hypothetical protein